MFFSRHYCKLVQFSEMGWKTHKSLFCSHFLFCCHFMTTEDPSLNNELPLKGDQRDMIQPELQKVGAGVVMNRVLVASTQCQLIHPCLLSFHSAASDLSGSFSLYFKVKGFSAKDSPNVTFIGSFFSSRLAMVRHTNLNNFIM